jgi:hypothetical protein
VISVKQQQISVGSQQSTNRRIRRGGKLSIHNPQSASLLQPAIVSSVEIPFVALLVVLSVVLLDPPEVRGWAEMLGRKGRGRRRRRVRMRMMRWLW